MLLVSVIQIACFKTTTVGLRRDAGQVKIFCGKSFKTTTVGLRRVDLGRIIYYRHCFKTTTVGLRHLQGANLSDADLRFQNHYGWIET